MQTLPTYTWIPYLTGDEVPNLGPTVSVFWIAGRECIRGTPVYTLDATSKKSVDDFKRRAKCYYVSVIPLVEKTEWEKDYDLYKAEQSPEFSLAGVENEDAVKRIYRDAWQAGYSIASQHYKNDL